MIVSTWASLVSKLALLVSAASASASPSPTPTGPVYAGNPAVRFALESHPLGIDPDGNARWLVEARFFDAQGNPTRILANSDLDWQSRDGYVQWQTRMRYGTPSAIVSTPHAGRITITVRANKPAIGTTTTSTDTRTWSGTRVVAQALGAHLVQIGWFPREEHRVRIVRVDGSGHREAIASILGSSSTYRDTSVRAGASYRYIVERAGRPEVALAPVVTPSEPPVTPLANASGKAMWLFFTNDPLDDIYVGKIDPNAIVDQAVRAGLHYVELRTAYGGYFEVTPEAKPTVDAIVDGLAAHGIGTIGWTVPRDLSFDDLQQSVRTAYYRTANGTPLAGLAIDLERGDEFMGVAPEGLMALARYSQILRQALGPSYLLVATVEDPYLEHLKASEYPYAQIARDASVLQPMSYWRMMRRKPTTPADVKTLLRASFEKLRFYAKRPVPISFGGQTIAEGRNGYPSAAEITASLEISRSLGAIGECFFDWDGTQPYQWDALASYPW